MLYSDGSASRGGKDRNLGTTLLSAVNMNMYRSSENQGEENRNAPREDQRGKMRDQRDLRAHATPPTNEGVAKDLGGARSRNE